MSSEDAGDRVIRGTALRTSTYLVGIALSVGSTALLTRHLGVADYGRYLTVISLLMIVAGLSEAGLDNIGVREYTNLTGSAREVAMRSLLGIRLLLACCGVAVAVAFAAIAYDSTMTLGTLIGGAGIVLLTMSGALGVQLFSSLRLGLVAAIDLLRQMVTVTLVALLVLAGAGLLSFFAVSVPAHLAMLVATLVLVRGRIPLLPLFHRLEWRRLLRQALPFALATAVGMIYYRVAIIIMSLISTPLQVGYFGASFRVVEVLTAIPPLLATSAFPVLARAARDDDQRLRYALQRMFEVGLLCGAGVALLVVIGAPVAIDVIGGAKFEPAVPLLRIQGLVLLSTFLIATWAYGLLALARYRAVLAANALAVAVVATLTFGLVPSLDARGAAIAMVVSEVVLAAAYATLLMRSRPDLRVSLRVVPRVALAAALALATVLIPGLPPIVTVVAAAIVYVGVAALVGAIPPEIWSALTPWRAGEMEP